MRKHSFLFLSGILLGTLFLFWKNFTNYFIADDFFHPLLARQQSLLDAFNLFRPAVLNWCLYRPLGTQVFWSIGDFLFGLNPLGYHVVYYSFFIINCVLVWYFLKSFILSNKEALLATTFYAFGASHYNQLFFLSTFQEVIMATTVLLTFITYGKRKWWSFVPFILALMSKETAIMTCVILLAYEFLLGKKEWKRTVPFFILAAGYFFAHKFLFGFTTSGEYLYDFTPAKIANNYLWYLLWSLGLPEDFVNLRIPTLVSALVNYPFPLLSIEGNLALRAFFVEIISLTMIIAYWLRTRTKSKQIVFGLIVFVGFLLPVGFFPFHKFASSLTLPLIGMSLIISVVLSRLHTSLILLFVGIYLTLAFLAVNFEIENNWVSKWSFYNQNLFNYLSANYPNKINSKTVFFFSDCSQTPCPSDTVKFSRDLYNSLSNQNAFKVIYPNSTPTAYYEFNFPDGYKIPEAIILDSGKFIYGKTK